ncbi:hypothetical protein [Paenibacillus abyssi]|uniref:Uncharacterized protein n=1 Tax=Paenibacillus abyssi TaxID=1340531 RepID=A0A917FL08_9BACL|nr:hypothetical protein [Paenibacillus abyssi]GGF90164.1 hypothetical protein GCM10010916_04440 [Paenibacillus abyssi]
MPIVCRHRQTGELAAAKLRNKYDLMYYGVIWWEDTETAEPSKEHVLLEHGFEYPEDWELVETSENRLKLFNVKLNNDPLRRLILEKDGSLRTMNSSNRSVNG